MKALFAALFFVLCTSSAFAQYIGMEHTVPRPEGRPGNTSPMPPLPTNNPPVVIVSNPTFAAIAFSQYTGGVGHSAGFQTENDARVAALNYCGPYCQIIAVARGGHIALAVGRGNGFGYAISGLSIEDAKEQALRNCAEMTRRCRIRAYGSPP